MSNKIKMALVLAGTFLVSVMILQLLKTSTGSKTDGGQIITDPYLLEGKRLSEIHCAACHKYPEPDLLTWQTWRFETLMAMAPFMGINYDDGNSTGQVHQRNSNPYQSENLYPSEPMVSREEWQNIRDYYLHAAPKEWPVAEKKDIKTDSLFFNARQPEGYFDYSPQVSSVKFDPGNRLIYLSSSNSRKFMVFNEDLNLVHKSGIESPISSITYLNDGAEPGVRKFLLTFIGHLNPSDAPYGSVATTWYDPKLQETGLDSVLVDGIARPVAGRFSDLNQDGLEDLIVNEFGHRAGSLFWVKNTGGGQPEKKLLIDTPGCIQSEVMDYTGNNRPDIIALCTQTDQALYLFTNKGNDEYERKALLRFEVTAGSSSFEIHDFNDDGLPDILYTSGDNADFSQKLKPYHGVYIYLNEGKDEFIQEWFYPVNGAYNAKARDFDGDGRKDLAVISYFADYENTPEEGFIYFKNEGNLIFTPYHHPLASSGRWITMDVADWTGNGRDDIILANFSEGPMQPADSIQARWEEGPLFLLLENLSEKEEE